MSFDQQFDLHDAWCREHALSLKALGEWMKDQELLDAAVQERLQRLQAQLRERRRNDGRRIEAIARIEQAAGGLDQRLSELHAQDAALDQVQARLEALAAPLIQVPGVAAAPAEAERVAV